MDKGKRLMSLDAFRGFDMFWIMGGESLVYAVAALFGCPDFEASFGHVPWAGLQFMDTVFPTFLFMAGVSFPFSAAKSLERGLSRGQIARRALRRGLTLIALGLVYGGFLKTMDFEHFRIPSVLAYIGFGWMVAAWIYLYVRSVKVRLGIAVGILAAVTAFFGLVGAPDAQQVLAVCEPWCRDLGTGPFTPVGNFGCYLDRLILAGHTYGPTFDNEGCAGLIPTIVTAMFGMFAGDIVRRGGSAATGRKALTLLGCGAASLAAGGALALYCPCVKNLWSPSFALIVGGYSFAMFALFYWLIDVKGWTKWCFFFTVIGLNSITIYMAQQFIDFHAVSRFFLGGLAKQMPDLWGALLVEIGYAAACWLFLHFLYRKNVFLKV